MRKEEFIGKTVTGILSILHTSMNGLSEEDVTRQFVKYGQNTLHTSTTNAVKILVKQFKSSLIYLLIIASVLSFLLKEVSDGTVIACILLLNAFLGFFQEYRSEKAIEKLSKLISHDVLVKRNGKIVLLDEKMIVPGDVVVLKKGDIVPGDIMLLEADTVQVDESQLTGESVAVAKRVQDGQFSKEISPYLLFAGSIIEQGECQGVVFATGYQTELGKIASLSKSTKKVTQYEKSLHVFSNYLMRITLFALAIIFIAKLGISCDFTHMTRLLLFIIALSVSVVPVSLHFIATIWLSNKEFLFAKK